jgi:hypothetical protein
MRAGWIVSGVIAVVAVVWLGCGWHIGRNAEALTYAQVAEGNRQLLPYRMLMQLENYRRGLLASTYRSCLALPADDPQTPPLNICFHNQLRHGPLFHTDAGWRIGLAAFHSEIDLDYYPPELGAMLSGFFAGKPPLVLDGYIELDGRSHGILSVSPFEIESPIGNASLAELRLRMVVSPALQLERSVLTGKGLQVDTMGTVFALGHLDAEVMHSGMLAATLPLYETRLSFKGLSLQGDQDLRGDIHMHGRSRDENGLLFSDIRIWLENLALTDFPASKGYFGLTLDGFDSAASLRLHELTRQISQQMEQLTAAAVQSGNADPQTVATAGASISELGEQVRAQITGPLLRAGKSRIALEMLLEDQAPLLSGLFSLTYVGGLPADMDMASLVATTPQQWLDMLDLGIVLEWQAALVPLALQDQLASWQQAGLLSLSDDRWRLHIDGRQGVLRLNEQPLALDELLQLVASLRPEPEAEQNQMAHAEEPVWYTEYDRLATLVTAIEQTGWYLTEYHGEYKQFPPADDETLRSLLVNLRWQFSSASGELMVEMPEQRPFRRRAVRMLPQWFDGEDNVYWNCLIAGGDIEEFESCEFVSPVRADSLPELVPAG